MLAAVLCLSSSRPARALEAVIDDFSDASALTEFVPDMNVLQDTLGSTVRNDTGLNKVIGGTRQLTLIATELDFPGLDYIVAGALLMPVNFFEYNSRDGADGSMELLYDANGSGLNTSLSFAQGIQVVIREADIASVALPGLDVTVTLVDNNMVSASQTQTITVPVTANAPLALNYAFSSFTGIDLDHIFSIEIALEPQRAGDLRLNLIGTFGTPLLETICDDGIDNNNNGLTDCQDPNCLSFPACHAEYAPTMSASGLLAAAAMLVLIAYVALRRGQARR
jgi:hypothetical protein